MPDFKELNKLSTYAYLQARSMGWYTTDEGHEKEMNFGERLMLTVSELSEALDADRKGRRVPKGKGDYFLTAKRHINGSDLIEDSQYKFAFEESIKDTLEDEIADTVIRLLDMCGYMNIDLAFHVEAKLQYNKLRGHKHGGRKY